MKIVLMLAYLLSIVAGVWAVGAWGVVPVGFGLAAPAAVYFVGITLVLRDLLQEAVGKGLTVALVIVGACLSALFSPALAVASGLAFLISELLDLAVYTRLRKSGLLTAILASNALSIVIDSLIFLTLAFGSLHFLGGQIVGKLIATIFAVVVIGIIRGRREVLPRN